MKRISWVIAVFGMGAALASGSANQVAHRVPGVAPACLSELRAAGYRPILPTWIPEGYVGKVRTEQFHVNGQRYVVVEYAHPDRLGGFSLQFAPSRLGTPIFADETATPQRESISNSAFGRTVLISARVRGKVETQTDWMRIAGPRQSFFSFVSLGIEASVARRIVASLRSH